MPCGDHHSLCLFDWCLFCLILIDVDDSGLLLVVVVVQVLSK
jgi:hypothetical protein